MIGQLNPQEQEVTIIGAGIAGLLAGYFLLQKNYRVTLYEAAAQPGGLIASEQTPHGLAERAAHSFRSSPALDQLCNDLRLSLVTTKQKKKYIWRHGRMRRFPLTIAETIGMLYRMFTAKAKVSDTQTMQDWAQHHLGRAACDALITPLLHGIYAAEPCEVLQEMIFPKLTVPKGKTLFQHLLKLRKQAGAKPIMTAPREGMAALVKALANAIEAHPFGTIHYNHIVTQLPTAGNIILSVPAAQAALLLHDTAPKTSAALKNVTYVPLVTITAFVNHTSQEGVGVLCAAHEKPYALGVLFNSSAFDYRVSSNTLSSYSFMMGGNAQREAVTMTDAQLYEKITEDTKTFFGSSAGITAFYPTSWPQALPLYNVDLKNALETSQHEWCAQAGHVLFGNYTGQISIRGLCDTAATFPTSQVKTNA